jgi:hypothetical protein
MKMAGVAVALLATFCAVMATSCDIGGGGVSTPERGEPIVIKGRLWFEPLGGGLSGELGDPCEAPDASPSLRAGAPVVVKDVAGSTIASGELEEGEIVDLTFAEHNGCRFPFTIEDVPVSAYYQIDISDDSARTGASFSYDELEAMDWFVEWGVGQ